MQRKRCSLANTQEKKLSILKIEDTQVLSSFAESSQFLASSTEKNNIICVDKLVKNAVLSSDNNNNNISNNQVNNYSTFNSIQTPVNNQSSDELQSLNCTEAAKTTGNESLIPEICLSYNQVKILSF